MADRIILASKSPRRKRLLDLINVDFDIFASSVPEYTPDNESPSDYVRQMAYRKAGDVAEKKSNSLIIGVDTVVAHKNRILGKPSNEQEAANTLKELSNDIHEVYSGVSLIKTNDEQITDYQISHEVTEVTFDKLHKKEIREYVDSGSPMDKAGSYGIQDDWGALFVKKIHGDYYNVVGFPLNGFYNSMKQFAPALLPHAF